MHCIADACEMQHATAVKTRLLILPYLTVTMIYLVLLLVATMEVPAVFPSVAGKGIEYGHGKSSSSSAYCLHCLQDATLNHSELIVLNCLLYCQY